MSKSGFRLLVGWLTEGTGGEAMGAGDGFTGESSRRGRSAVMQVVNNHIAAEGMLSPILRAVAQPPEFHNLAVARPYPHTPGKTTPVLYLH